MLEHLVRRLVHRVDHRVPLGAARRPERRTEVWLCRLFRCAKLNEVAVEDAALTIHEDPYLSLCRS